MTTSRNLDRVQSRDDASQRGPDTVPVHRLRPLWYGPIFSVPCWFSVLILTGSGLLRLGLPPSAGQEPFTPYLMILGGLVYPGWHLWAASSESTFLELSREELRRSICGRVRSWRWDTIERFRVRSRGPRGGSWLSADVRETFLERDPLGPGQMVTKAVPTKITNLWNNFAFGSLEPGELAEKLNAWRAWATSGSNLPSPSLEPAPISLVPDWILLEIWIGLLICLAFSSILAAYFPGSPMNVLAGLMSFAICSLLVAVLVTVAVGPTRIRRHAIAWQLGWIAFVLMTSWLGHVAISTKWRA